MYFKKSLNVILLKTLHLKKNANSEEVYDNCKGAFLFHCKKWHKCTFLFKGGASILLNVIFIFYSVWKEIIQISELPCWKNDSQIRNDAKTNTFPPLWFSQNSTKLNFSTSIFSSVLYFFSALSICSKNWEVFFMKSLGVGVTISCFDSVNPTEKTGS